MNICDDSYTNDQNESKTLPIRLKVSPGVVRQILCLAYNTCISRRRLQPRVETAVIPKLPVRLAWYRRDINRLPYLPEPIAHSKRNVDVFGILARSDELRTITRK